MTTPSPELLLPCPFCGGQAEIKEIDVSSDGQNTPSSYAYLAKCKSSACYVKPEILKDSRAYALEAWNTRPTPSSAPAERPKRDKTLIIRNAGRQVTDGFGIGRLEGSGVPITSGAWVSLEDHKKLITEYEALESCCTNLEKENARLKEVYENDMSMAAAIEKQLSDQITKLQSPLPHPVSDEAVKLAIEIGELALDLPTPSGGHHSADCPWITGEGSVLCECGWNDHCDDARETRKQIQEKLNALRNPQPKSQEGGS